MKKLTHSQSVSPDLFCSVCKAMLGVDIVREHQFCPSRKWRFDYAVVNQRIALEVEGGVWTGGRHTSPRGFLGDLEKYNTATLMGWRVVRTTPEKLMSDGIGLIEKLTKQQNYESK